MFTIYSLTHRETQRRYIGSTSQPLALRLSLHRYSAKKRPTNPLHEVMKRDGFGAFDVDTLETADDLPSADAAERKWIAHFGATDPRRGFNIEAGGRKKGAGSAAASTRAKMRGKWTPERKADNGARHRGKTLSDEAKRGIAEKARARASARHAAGFLPKTQSEYSLAYRARNLEECRRRDREAKRRVREAGRVRK